MPSTRRGSTVTPTINSRDSTSTRREGKKNDLVENVTVYSVRTTGKTRASNKTKGSSCKKRTTVTSPKKPTKKKRKQLPDEFAGDKSEEEENGKKVLSVLFTTKEQVEMVKKVSPLFSTTNSTTPTMSLLLT